MKKAIMAAWLCAATLFVQAQERNVLLEQFKASAEFERVQKHFGDLGKVDFENATVNYVEANGSHPYGSLSFIRDGRITGVLEFVPVPEKLEKLLPNNDRYAMQLIDYRKYEADLLTGTILTYDLNYDNFLAAETAVEKGKVTRFEVFEKPEEIIKKYAGLSPLPSNDKEQERKAHVCDYNGNGNLSFSECYKCAKTICHGDPDCDFLCNLINQTSGFVGVPKACHLSFAASCVIIALFM